MEEKNLNSLDVHQTEKIRLIQKISKLHKWMYVGMLGYVLWPCFLAYIWIIYQLFKFKKANLEQNIAEIVTDELTTAIISIIVYVVAFTVLTFMENDLLIGGIGVLIYFGGFLFVIHKTITNGKSIKQCIKNLEKQNV